MGTNPTGQDLTRQQAAVFAAVSHYHEALGEPCPGTYIARKLNIAKQVVQKHLDTLHRKGWLRGPSAPAVPTRGLPPEEGGVTESHLGAARPACDVPDVKPAAKAGPAVEVKRIALGPLSFRADVAAQTMDEEARTVDLVFSTGAPVERYDWQNDTRYLETLSLDPGHVRIDRLNSIGPLLDGHSAYSVGDVIGAVVPGSVTLTAKQARAKVRFSKRAAVDGIWGDVKDGIVRSVSVGYRVYRYDEETAGKDNKLPVRKATDWEPFEISMVPIPADAGAHVRGERAKVDPNSCEVLTRKEKPMENDARPSETIAEVDPLAPPARRAPAPAPEPDERKEGAEAERKRCQGITLGCRAARLPQSFADKLIADGTRLEDAQTMIFAELARRGGDDRGPGRVPADVTIVGEDPLVHVRTGIENAILHKVHPEQTAYRMEPGDDGQRRRVPYKIGFPLTDEGRQYRGMALLDVARAYLHARGIRTTGLSKMDLAGVALGLRGGMHTTSDFANLLADLPNKILRQAYLEAPQTFGPIVRNSTLSDFKPARLLQLGEGPALLLVGEHGEFTEGTMGESKEQYQLLTYGRKFSITRQSLVNDDTDAFSRVPMAFGRQARNKESDLVWNEITANANMGDGTALFATAHNNLSGTSDAIAVASIGAGRAAMRKQTGIDGVSLMNLNPLYLIVPAAKETIADQFVSTALMASQSSSVNPFAGKLTVVAEPRLDANSGTAWYLAADPGQIDIIVLSTLEGTAGPTVDSRLGFDIDGIEFKIRHDIAAKAVDFRGLYKNPGA